MANSNSSSLLVFAPLAMLFLGLLMANLQSAEAQIGVCYGMDGNNLPSAQEVVALYNQYGIRRMRIYRPEPRALQALSGSNIEVMVGILNNELQRLANSQAEANAWVQNNILNYRNVKFRYIAVGNEAHNDQSAQYLVPAMMRIRDALRNNGLDNQIKISSSVSFGVLEKSYPPFDGTFRRDLAAFINPLVSFLVENQSPLMVNLYPYFAYRDPNSGISLDYALFRAQSGPYGYTNLFDAQLDAVYAALEKTNVALARNGGSTAVIITESGWPSRGGGQPTSVENAGAYYSNLAQHVKSGRGTPKRPNTPMEVYLFSMFDENLKPGSSGIEGAWGLFYPNKQPKYSINFN